MYELDYQLCTYFVLEYCDKIVQLRFNFDACPMHSPFGFVTWRIKISGRVYYFVTIYSQK